jgi:hypothetical protein
MKHFSLSKSRFVAGCQCHKQLWWRVHEPEALELQPDAGLQAIFDRGHAVGEAAQGYVPGGVLIEYAYDQKDQRLQATSKALKEGAPAIYEASFMPDGVFVAVDILEKARGGWNLIEVKSTTTDKPEHLPDVAVQLHVLENAELKIKRAELMHLNNECRFPDLSNLFSREDLTTQARDLQPWVRKEIKAQLKVLKGSLPDVEPGPFCHKPYECPFIGRCWQPFPPHHISTLYRIGQRAAELMEDGVETIFDLPEDYPMSQVASRQRQSVLTGKMIVESGLKRALADWDLPIAFLDFETIAPPIPVWNGCRPYSKVPV